MKKVLVIEDDNDICCVLKKRLEDNKFDVEIAQDGYSVLGHLRSDPAPDVIILDLMLPGRTGLELLCSLKSRWTDTRIFIFSGHAEYKKKIHLYKDYICGFHCKTDGITKLIDAINNKE